MSLSNKAKKRLEVAIARREEALEIVNALEGGITEELVDEKDDAVSVDAKAYTDAQLTAQLAGLTSIPSNSVSSTTTVDSASTTFVDVMSTTITLAQSTTIHGIFVGVLQAVTSAAVAGFRVVIDTQNGQTMSINLANTTDLFTGQAQLFSTSLGAGTYTIKAQIQRTSGTGTVRFIRGSLVAQANQATVNSVSPSRIYYVAKNGSASPTGDGSFNRPFALISQAVAAAQALPSSFNAPIAISVAPGVGSVQYTETAPINITAGGLCIVSQGSQDFKGVQVHLSGAINVNMSGSSLFFAMVGFEINCGTAAGFAGINAALHVTGTASQRIFCGSMVLNSNSTAKGAIYCDNSSATITCTNSEIKAGTSAGPNTTPIRMIAGNFIAYDCDMANRQSANAGLCMELGTSVASVTLHDGQVAGSIQKDSNNTTIIINGTIISSGVNACIESQLTAGTGSIQAYKAVFNCSNTYAISGGELCSIGRISYIGTCQELDSALNSGSGPQFYMSDIKSKYRANATDWDVSAPTDVSSALNRMASLLKTLNGGNPIP